jgi:hypothetical protein
MGLSPEQIKAVEDRIRDREKVHAEAMHGREDLYMICRNHETWTEAECLALVAAAEARIKASADTISASLTVTP